MEATESFFHRLFRWTHKDPVLVNFMEESNRRRVELNEQLFDLTKATLDSEDGWMLRMVETKEPTCVLKAVSACPDKEDTKGN
jgi:hypothetical protein